MERLRREGHDVLWINEILPGGSDDDVLELSFAQSCILLTEDWDFGELVVRHGRRALGVVIVALPAIGGSLKPAAETVAEELNELGENLLGNLTILEPGRVRQRRILSGTTGDEGSSNNDG